MNQLDVRVTFVSSSKQMKKETLQTFLICCLSIFFFENSKAQSVINSASGGVEINNNSFEYSIGEMVLVSTVDAGTTLLTQGFLQPSQGMIISVDRIESNSVVFSVYPNPSSGFLQLQLKDVNDGWWTIALHDASGRLVRSSELYFTSGAAESFDISTVAAGCYFIHMYSEDRTDTPFDTIRVIKY